MTIQQLEQRTGLERTAVRFYEREGFLTPKRLPNGYRDYSEEDALTLEKIALLRRLDLPLDSIRAVQKGDLPLSLALEQQEDILRLRQRDTARALEISCAIRREGASYYTLQPVKYQSLLSPARPASPPQLPRKTLPAHGCRLRRVAARLLDQMLYSVLLCVLLCRGFDVPPFSEQMELLLAVLSVAAVLLLEPLLLCTWGWTPGKRLMGLRLRLMGEDRKPTWGAAMVRCLGILWHGFGLFVPVWQWICMFRSFQRAEKEEPQPWDAYDFDYTLTARPPWKDGLLALVLAAGTVLSIQADSHLLERATLPPHRDGPITAALYAENVTAALRTSFERPNITQQPDGSYLLEGDGNALLGTSAEFSAQNRQTVTTAEGVVTAVSFRIASERPGQVMFVGNLGLQKALVTASVMALTGSSYPEAEEALEQAGIYDQSREGSSLTFSGWQICRLPAERAENEGSIDGYTITRLP